MPSSSWIRRHVLGLVAMFTALTVAPAWGATIGSSDIEPNAVLSKHIKDGQVRSSDIGAGQVNRGNLALGAVTAPKLATGAVSTPKLANRAVGAAKVKANALGGGQINELALDFTILQRRIASACPAGQAIHDVASSGAVNCLAVGSGGDITDVNAGTGLTGGGSSGSVTLALANPFQLPQGCANGQVAKSSGSNSWECANDVDTTGNDWHLNGNSGTTGSDFLGTTDNQPLNLRVDDARGLRLEPASDGTNQSPNVVGGIADNAVDPGAYAATIAGGGRADAPNPGTANRVTDDFGTVGGGADNRAGDASGTVDDRLFATVAGGLGNTAGASSASVGGGNSNAASGNSATVAGGNGNAATGAGASVGGGVSAQATADRATVSGGDSNTAGGQYASVPGGFFNTAQGNDSLAAGLGAQANHDGAFVWGDSNPFFFASTAQDQFSVRSTGGDRFVTGIDGLGNPTSGLELPAGTSGWSTLVNGQPFDIRVNGARGLRIDPASDGTNQSPNLIGGSADNSVTAGVHSAVISGGGRLTPGNPATANRVTDSYGTVAGGASNQAGDGAGTVNDRQWATVGGGAGNTASGAYATIGGGGNNPNTASGARATVSGGGGNTASGGGATVGGGGGNTASGGGATVPGGNANSAFGDVSLAAGFRAKANHTGTFVWADSNNFDFASTAQDQFSVRSTGGARFVTAINGFGDPTAGVQLAPGGGSWASLSDRAAKTAVDPISGRSVLAKLDSIPVATWSYRAQDDSIRHIGPMAQDFYRAFRVGEDRRHIDSVDADGVALAAIKGLNRKVQHLQRQVASLKKGRSR
jgi:trimeric autotransporter adhesin